MPATLFDQDEVHVSYTYCRLDCLLALGTFTTVQGYISITAAQADIATGGTLYRAPCGCSQPCEVPYHIAPP